MSVQPRLLAAACDKDDRPTPQAFFDELDAEFRFTLDVAASSLKVKKIRRRSDQWSSFFGQRRKRDRATAAADLHLRPGFCPGRRWFLRGEE